jgi:hypothetical protein
LRTGNTVAISGFAYITGTYAQTAAGTTITVTINNHGLANGATITLDFLTVAGGTVIPPDGVYTITNVATNTFDISIATATTVSSNGNVRLDIRGYNATNTEVTVVNTTTFTYFSPGAAQTAYTIGDGRVNLGGLPQARSYVFTWYTPWDEESIASKPSTTLYLKEGQTVTVTGLPSIGPSGANQIDGIRLYRTVPSASDTEYFLLQTLWFPLQLHHMRRTSGVVRAHTFILHNLEVGDRVRIAGLVTPLNVFNGDHVVTAVGDDFHFEFALAGANVGQTNAYRSATYSHPIGTTVTINFTSAHNYSPGSKIYVEFTGGVTTQTQTYTVATTPTTTSLTITTPIAGTVITSGSCHVGGYSAYDVSEDPATMSAVYWGDGGSYSFTDNFDGLALTDILATDNYAAPPDDLQGLISHRGEILVGFFGNTVCFSEVGKPHAWPIEYRKVVDYPVVGLVSIGGYVLVLTEGYPYTISVSDPAANVSLSKIDALYPCLNRKGIVNMGYGVVYPTYDGLAVFSFTGGTQIITRNLQVNDTWTVQLDPTTIRAAYYGTNYVGAFGPYDWTSTPANAGAIVFERDDKAGFFTTLGEFPNAYVPGPISFTAAWYDAPSGKLFFVTNARQFRLPFTYTADYTQTASTTVTVSSSIFQPHHLSTGDQIYIDWNVTTGTVPPNGYYTVTVLNSYTYTIQAPSNTSTGFANFPPRSVIYEWDRLDRLPLQQTWKSKVIKTKDYVNIGVARVIGDYDVWETIDDQWDLYDAAWDYVIAVTFKLFVDKSLFTTVVVNNSNPFRLPTGYLSDTFEISVSGNARIREIQIAETPTDLRTL